MAAETCVEEFDVGVLVVHGIGTQGKGSTVREFVDPVVALLDRLGEGSSKTELVPAVKGFIGIRPPPIRETPSKRWLVGEAWWADDFDAPNRSEVSRWLVDASSWFVYFFVARLWARSDVRRDHIVLGLLAATSAAAAIGWAAADNVPEWLWVLVASSWLAVLAAARWRPRSSAAVVAGSVLLLWPLAAAATLAMLIVFLVGLLPGSWTAKVRRFQLSLAGTLGDTYALISSPRRERAMFDAITSATEALLTELDKGSIKPRPLVVTAHSQGASLMYRLLHKDPGFQQLLKDRRVTLVTHGSAILPIHVFECRRQGSGGWWVRLSGLGGLIGLVLLAVSLGRVVSGALSGWTTVTAGAAFVLSAAALWSAHRDERHTRCVEEPKETAPTSDTHDATVRPGPEPKTPNGRRRPAKDLGRQPVCPSLPVPDGGQLRWVDLWAPWDPVPNGPLDLRRPHVDRTNPYKALPGGADSGTAFLPCRVANDHQPWTDHTTYRTNNEDVVSRWIGEIAFRAGGSAPEAVEPTTGRGPEPVRQRRHELGQWLLSLQGLALLAAILVTVARWDEIDDLGRWLLRTFPQPLRSVVDTAAAAVPEAIRNAFLGARHDPARVYGFVAAAAATLATIGLPTLCAAGWRRAESKRFLVDGTTPKRIAWAWASVTIGLFVIALVLASVVAAGSGKGEESDPVTATVTLKEAASPRLHATLTFQPVGADERHALTVETDRKGVASAQLDPTRRYVISVKAEGGKDCKVENPNAAEIRAVCEPAGGVREGASRPT